MSKPLFAGSVLGQLEPGDEPLSILATRLTAPTGSDAVPLYGLPFECGAADSPVAQSAILEAQVQPPAIIGLGQHTSRFRVFARRRLWFRVRFKLHLKISRLQLAQANRTEFNLRVSTAVKLKGQLSRQILFPVLTIDQFGKSVPLISTLTCSPTARIR